MRIAFVAVNYNNSRITVNYVENILELREIDKHEIKIIIVDNASKEADYNTLKAELSDYRNVIVKRSEENRGYFGGMNVGLDEIERSKFEFDYIIAGNNDVFFERDFLKKLERKDYPPEASVIVPDLETISGIHQNPQYVNPLSRRRILGMDIYYSCYLASILVGILYGFKRKKKRDAKKEKDTESKMIYLCTGAVLIMRKSFIEKCCRLDESLFLWGEEVAIAHQLYCVDNSILYDPELVVIHLENASVKKIESYKSFRMRKKSFVTYRKYLLEHHNNLKRF